MWPWLCTSSATGVGCVPRLSGARPPCVVPPAPLTVTWSSPDGPVLPPERIYVLGALPPCADGRRREFLADQTSSTDCAVRNRSERRARGLRASAARVPARTPARLAVSAGPARLSERRVPSAEAQRAGGHVVLLRTPGPRHECHGPKRTTPRADELKIHHRRYFFLESSR